MRATISTRLDCPAAKAWDRVTTPQLMIHVMRPMIRVAALDPPAFPARWEQGVTYRLRAWAFGIVPLGIHHLGFETIDDVGRTILTRESNALVAAWDHRISIGDAGETACIYKDEIDVASGLLTGPVWLFASLFYRHRQRRWRKLARML